MKIILPLLFFITLVARGSNAAAFLSKWLLSSGGRRDTPGSLWQCPELPPDIAYCSQPQFSFHSSSVQEANVWIALLSSRCHANLMKFVCTVHNPVCLHSHQVMPILPCREFCEEVHSACVARMSLFGFKWPEQVDCGRLPREAESMCVTSKRESVTCAPCNQQISRENIVKKYCDADLVIKSQISGVSAFGNTSSLLVKLDRISERFHPLASPLPALPSLPNPSYTANHQRRQHGFLDTSNEEERLTLDRRRQQVSRSGAVQAPSRRSADHMADDDPAAEAAATKVASQVGNTTNKPRMRKRKGRLGYRRRQGMGVSGNQRRRRSPSPGSFLQFTRPSDGDMGQSALLECAGCNLDLPTSPMAPNSATRWLVMARKINGGRLNNNTASSPPLKIISIIPWKKDDQKFRDALADIRTIPRAILCNPNTKVEMNFDAFRANNKPNPPPPTRVQPPRSAYQHISWSRYRSPTQSNRLVPPKPGILPPQFEGLFQNDASASGVPKKDLTKMERRQLRKQQRAKQQGAASRVHQVIIPPMPAKVDPLERRKRRQERLSKMTPQERDAWKARRRERRALRQRQGMLQPRRNATS